VTAAVVLAGAPAVAFALADDPGDTATRPGSATVTLPPADAPASRPDPAPATDVGDAPAVAADPAPAVALDPAPTDDVGVASADVDASADVLAAPTPVVPTDPAQLAIAAAVAVLVDTYTWDERSDRVTTLQQLLGVTVDGWYAHTTRQAHLDALQAAGLPPTGVPALPAAHDGSSGPSASQWAALRACESNGDYSITNPSGRYRGAYQFDRSTWDGVARRHHPHLVGVDPAAASPADQDAMAQALYGERGAQPWPTCGRHLR
jgi:hypothetical protein